MRFYLVDRINNLEVGQSIQTTKCWTLTDDIFNDHFPGFPIVPGVLIIESVAQSLGMLIEKSYEKLHGDKSKPVWAILSIVHKAKFKNFTIPGDQMVIEGELKSIDGMTASASAIAKVNGEIRAQVELSFALFPSEKLPDPVLTQQRSRYFDTLTLHHRLKANP